MNQLISSKMRLRDCDPWPTMQWLAKPVATRLDRLVSILQKNGEPIHRSDVVGALVLACKTTDADELRQAIQPYKANFAPPHRRRETNAMPITLQLPAPISQRIDVLVEIAREEIIVYRHDLIGTLIMAASTDLEALEKLVTSYRVAVAGDAAPRSRDARRVLSAVKPQPGPRRWREARKEALRSPR
jgi:hypothetical protein